MHDHSPGLLSVRQRLGDVNTESAFARAAGVDLRLEQVPVGRKDERQADEVDEKSEESADWNSRECSLYD